jgi:hypothetical protein
MCHNVEMGEGAHYHFLEFIILTKSRFLGSIELFQVSS